MIITLILYRWLFKPMVISQLAPSYWINMGAAAITTLAGVQLAATVVSDPVLAVVRGYIIGQTVLFWSIASWWIPLLVGANGLASLHRTGPIGLPIRLLGNGVSARHVRRGDFELFAGDRRTILTVIPPLFFWAAIATWCLTFFGMMRRLVGVIPILIGGQARQQRME